MRALPRTLPIAALACAAFEFAFPAQDPGSAAAGPDPRAVERAIERGLAFLKERGTADEGRHLDAANARPGLRALVLYTLLKGGVSPTDALVDDLLFGLTRDTIDQTYDAACMILALEAHDALAHRAWIEDLATRLLEWQEPEGAWSYPGLVIDLSNTQYAALGLWAASRAGVDADPAVWSDLARGTFAYQSEDGGFSYTAPPGGSTGSMTSAGIGVLAIAELQLALADRLEPAFAAELAERRRRGLAWLAANFAVDTNPRLGGFHYYYLYGLERMGALAGIAHVGAHAWYAEGADWLVRAQGEDGAWEHGTDLADTCFAVLFLERATGRAKHRVTLSGPSRETTQTTEESDAPVRIECSVERGVARAKVAALSPSAVAPFLWPGEEDRGPRVRRVEYFAGGAPAGVALGSPERPADEDEWPAFLRPRASGPLVARVHLLPPPGADASPVLESPPLEIELPPAAAASRVARGVEGLERRARVRTSSELKRSKDHPEVELSGEHAVDGNAATPWLTKAGDAEPELRIQPRKPVEALGVVISPPALAGRGSAPLALPTRVEVVLNGAAKEAITAELAPVGRTFVPFAEESRVRTVELRIVARSGPEGAPTGFGEVGLRIAPPKEGKRSER